MPPELTALIDKPLLLAIVLGIGAACGMVVERIAENMKKAERRAYWERRKAGRGSRKKVVPFKDGEPTRTETAAEQLRRVMDAGFRPRALLNKPERRLLGVLDHVLAEETPGWRAMGQVSLGEILYSQDKGAFWAINAKRVDLLIVDKDCHPLHAVEFHGTGHHKGPEAAARDAVKKEALRRAGIGYVEVVSGDTPSHVREMVRKLVGRTVNSS